MTDIRKAVLVWGVTALALAGAGCSERLGTTAPRGGTNGRIRGTVLQERRIHMAEGVQVEPLPPIPFDERVRDGRAREPRTGLTLVEGGYDVAQSPMSYTDSAGHVYEVIFEQGAQGGPPAGATHLMDGVAFARTTASYTEVNGEYILTDQSYTIVDGGQTLLEQTFTVAGADLSAGRGLPSQLALLLPALGRFASPPPLMAHAAMKCQVYWEAYAAASAALIAAAVRTRLMPNRRSFAFLVAAAEVWATTWVELVDCMRTTD